MKLHFAVTERAYLDFNIYHYEHSDVARKQLRRARLAFPLIMALIGLAFCASMTWRFGVLASSFVYLGVCLIAAGLWYALYPSAYRKSRDKRLRAFFAEDFGGKFFEEYSLEVLDDRLLVETEISVTKIYFAKILKLAENKGCLYIYTGKTTALIVPLDAFPGPDAYRELLDRLGREAIGA